ACWDAEMRPVGDRLGSRRVETAAGWNVECRGAMSVHVADVRKDTDLVIFARLDEDNAGAVAEEHRGGPVRGIDDRRHAIRAADEHAARGAALHQLGPGAGRVHAAR